MKHDVGGIYTDQNTKVREHLFGHKDSLLIVFSTDAMVLSFTWKYRACI